MVVYEIPPADFNPRVEVSACLVEYDQRILLLLRQDHKPQGNTWCVPAGKLDPGDTSLDAVLREVNEETGLILQEKDVTHFKSLSVRYPNFDFVYHIYHTRLPSEPKIQIAAKEHKEYRWATPREALMLPLIPDEDVCIKMFYRI